MNRKWKIYPKKSENLFDQLLINRGVDDFKFFLNPPLPSKIIRKIVKENLGGDNVQKATLLIKEAIENNSPIFIHGDYDVDGVCSAAILWEALYFSLGYKNVFPYIPNRFSEGYGLSKESIDNMLGNLTSNVKGQPLLITVDCGIGSVDEVEYAKEKGFRVIVCDHHQKGEEVPKADAILWTDKLCGAGISYVLAMLATSGNESDGLDLVALATIADLQVLRGFNRSFTKHGLDELNKLKRVGLKALVEVSGVLGRKIGTYEVGWILAPRLNAAGRLEDALDSLRLLCTRNYNQALEIARRLSAINLERQRLTESMYEESKNFYLEGAKIIISHSRNFHEGIIGLVAGKLVQEYYLPSVVLSVGDDYTKGSARSISSFNVIEALRNFSSLFESVGGHPMAAGFTIKTENLEILKEKLNKFALENLKDDDITPSLKIDAQITFRDINFELLDFILGMEPFGVGNSTPLFLTEGVEVLDIKTVGASGNHLRLFLRDLSSNQTKACVYFNGAGAAEKLNLEVGDLIDVVYSIAENVWNSERRIDLRIRDVRKSTP